MKKTHHTAEQIITKLRKVEALTADGKSIAVAVKQIEVSEQTYYRWKRQYGQIDRDEARRLRELEKENARLKKLVAELTLDKEIMKEALRGKY